MEFTNDHSHIPTPIIGQHVAQEFVHLFGLLDCKLCLLQLTPRDQFSVGDCDQITD